MCSQVVGQWSSIAVSQIFIRESAIKTTSLSYNYSVCFPQNVKLSHLGEEVC